MQGAIFTYGLLAALAIALVVASVTDLRRREIDNGLNLAIALGAPLFWWATGLDLAGIGWQVALAGGTFVVLLGLFAINAMGGGDVKLLTALALWVEPIWFLKLVVFMSLAGGLLTIVCFAAHRLRRDEGRIAVPYGVAISLAGLWILSDRYLPAPHFAGLVG